jgi:hypothetical protein
MALGHGLELWKVMTPKDLGIDGPMVEDLARKGLLYAIGYQA